MSSPERSATLDDNPRPHKRQRVEQESFIPALMTPLPPSILLLSLQSLLAHPPTHRNHTRSLFLSLFALRKCLSFSGLATFMECRAWTELAEIGFRIGLDEPGIESEVEKAITKALLIAHKHPSLRVYKLQITRLSARLAAHQNNPKFAQNTLKKLLTNFLVASDPPHLTYSAHLAYISSLASMPELSTSGSGLSSNANFRALSAIRDLHELATRKKHSEVALLAMVLELRELIQHGQWGKVVEALESTEKGLNISADIGAASLASSPNDTPVASSSHSASSVPKFTPVCGTTNFEKVLIIHVLIFGILFHTYVGDSFNTQIRLKKLHDMLDGGALDAFGTSGVVQVEFLQEPTPTPPLELQVTHPRVIFSLGFLVSSVAKRDPVGRKPKKKLFASEGTLAVERELRKEMAFPIWASASDVRESQLRMHKMKVDMICELIGVAISRSEFDDAERELARVIALTRTHDLFSLYSARITLHQAHLAHSLSQTERAQKCYQVSAFLSRRRSPIGPKASVPSNPEEELEDGCEDYWVNVSARAGEMWLRIGVASRIEDDAEREKYMETLRKDGMMIAKECEGLGGTLKAIGAVLTACLSKEFLVAKTHLRTALNLSTAAQDNHLRALVLALIAAQYVHTSTEHAEAMLGTAEQLAAGLGAQPKPVAKHNDQKKANLPAAGGGDGVGNAHLRLWIGERSLELKRRAGDERASLKQLKMNEKLEQAVIRVQKRKFVQVI